MSRWARLEVDRPPAARRAADRALAVCARYDAPELEVELRCTVAMIAAASDDGATADDHVTRAAALVDRTGVAMSRSMVAIARGYVLARRGQPRAATRELTHGLGLHDRAGQAFGRPFALWCFGNLAREAGEHTAAVEHLADSLQEARRRGDGDAIACALEGLAAVCGEDGRAELGARLLGAAEARRERMGPPSPCTPDPSRSGRRWRPACAAVRAPGRAGFA